MYLLNVEYTNLPSTFDQYEEIKIRFGMITSNERHMKFWLISNLLKTQVRVEKIE